MFLLCPSVAFCSFFNWYSLFDYQLFSVQLVLPKIISDSQLSFILNQVYYHYLTDLVFLMFFLFFIYVFVSK